MNLRQRLVVPVVALLALTVFVAPGEAGSATLPPEAYVFYEAATRGDTAMVESMLADTPGLALLKFKQGVTPLHAAALSDEPRTVELLLKRGAYVDARGGQQRVTPLFLAVTKGHGRVAMALLRRRADPNASGRLQGEDGAEEVRPLHLAAIGGHTDIADELIQRGAILTAQSSIGGTAAEYAKRYGSIPIALMLDAYHRLGLVRGAPVAALIRGIAAGDSARVSALLDRHKSLVTFVLENQWTPLHLAAWQGSQPVCDALLGHGADPHAVEAGTSWTPAFRAHDSGHTALCEYLRRRVAAPPSRKGHR